MDVASLLRDLPQVAVLLCAGLLIVAEAGLLIGVVLPGASAVLALGFLSSLRVVSLPAAVLTMVVAAPLGAQVGYWTGRRYGVPARLPVMRRASELVAGRSARAVLIAQWFVVARTLVPRLVGAAEVRYRRFAALSVPIAAVWGAAMVTAGYAAGAAYDRVGLGFAVAAAILLLVIVIPRWLAARRSNRSGTARTPAL